MPIRTVSQEFIWPYWGKIFFLRISGQIHKDCRFRTFTLTSSLHQQRSLLRRKDSRLRYVLVRNFLRKLCYGSKEWRWLNQWMISNLRALSQELLVQTLNYSTRELLAHWTKSPRIQASRERSVWRTWNPKKRTVSSEEDKSLTWSTSTSGWLEPTILSNYADLLTGVLRNDDIQEFDSKWDGFFVYDESPTWWNLGKNVQIKNTSVWKT